MQISRERIERVARMYPDGESAAAALGITPQSFTRLCRKHGIETPRARRQRRRREMKNKSTKPQ